MADIWNSAGYWERGAVWRERALQLAETDATRDICARIAADFESLARTLEERERLVDAAKRAPSVGGIIGAATAKAW